MGILTYITLSHKEVRKSEKKRGENKDEKKCEKVRKSAKMA
jgi:hypothetical protein